MIDPEWHGAGLGGILHKRAVEYARNHGVRGFTADVMVSNSRMLRIFRHGDHEVSVTSEGGISELTIIFSP